MYKPVFNATNEWQELPEGMSIPGGCHVRMDITTGKQSVKLDSDKHNNKALVVQETPPTDKETSGKVDTKKVVDLLNKNAGLQKDISETAGTNAELRSDKPTSWKGLLEWSMKYKDGTADSEFSPLDDE
ncbi:hypothetical protein SARC_15815, partial [Sphaeroforma arctica JP610]